VSIAQRIDITGLNRAYQRVTNTERALVQQEFEQTKQEAVYNVTTAYYSALRAKELIRVSEAAVQQSEEQVRIAQVQFTQGNYAKNDVLRAKSQLANNQQSLISAQNQAAIARNSLANTIGLDPATPMALAGEDTATLPNLPQLDKEMLLTEAFSHRPEAVRAQLNQEKAKTNTRIARQGQEPYLTASLNGNYNATDGIPSSRRATGSVGLTLSFPLSDGGVTAGNIRTARADEQIAEAQIVEYRNGITAEVEQAIIAVRDAYERAQSALPALEEAREGYRLSEARLKAGAGTQLALYDSQAALVQAEVNAINARYDYFSSLARLARAIGTSVENP
jgi:outer membrane protein TolC